MRSFSPNYNVRLIYGGKGAKSLISRLRSGTLQPNEKRHGQLHRMTMCPGVWRTLDCLSKLDLLSNNELRTSWAQSRVDRIPSMNARLVRKVQVCPAARQSAPCTLLSGSISLMEPRMDGPRFMTQHKDVAWINGRLAAVIKIVAA